MARVLFFGHLKDRVDKHDIELSLPANLTSVSQLIELISGSDEQLRDSLSDPSIRVCVNQSIMASGTLPDDIREIAFMPPLSGG